LWGRNRVGEGAEQRAERRRAAEGCHGRDAFDHGCDRHDEREHGLDLELDEHEWDGTRDRLDDDQRGRRRGERQHDQHGDGYDWGGVGNQYRRGRHPDGRRLIGARSRRWRGSAVVIGRDRRNLVSRARYGVVTRRAEYASRADW